MYSLNEASTLQRTEQNSSVFLRLPQYDRLASLGHKVNRFIKRSSTIEVEF